MGSPTKLIKIPNIYKYNEWKLRNFSNFIRNSLWCVIDGSLTSQWILKSYECNFRYKTYILSKTTKPEQNFSLILQVSEHNMPKTYARETTTLNLITIFERCLQHEQSRREYYARLWHAASRSRRSMLLEAAISPQDCLPTSQNRIQRAPPRMLKALSEDGSCSNL